MHIQLSFDSLFISLAGGVGTLQFFHLLFSKRENLFANRILAIFLISILYVNLLNWLWLTGLLVEVPDLFRTGRPLSYIFAPLLYIYLRASLYRQKVFRKYDWIFLVPLILVYFEFFPFYLSPTFYKIQCILKAVAVGVDNLEGLLIGRLHGILFIIYDLLIALVIFKEIRKFKQMKQNISPEEEQIITWVTHLVVISLIVLVAFLGFWLTKLEPRIILRFYFLQNAAVIYFISIYLLVKPAIFNGTFSEKNRKRDEEQKTEKIPAEKWDLYDSIIKKLIEEEKIFLRKKLSLKNLSEISGISIHHLSAFINKKFEMSFTDLINKMRIDFVLEKISSDDWKRYSLEGLAREAGFSSRTSFFTAFKKFTDISPSDYLKMKSESKAN